VPEKARRQADLATADLVAAQQLLAAADARLLGAEGAARGALEGERQKQVFLGGGGGGGGGGWGGGGGGGGGGGPGGAVKRRSGGV
jgi:hypothetical protein